MDPLDKLRSGNIQGIPPDVLRLIASRYLSVVDISHLCQSSRRFNDMLCNEKKTPLDKKDFQRFWKVLYERDFTDQQEPLDGNYRQAYKDALGIFQKYGFGRAVLESLKKGYEKILNREEVREYIDSFKLMDKFIGVIEVAAEGGIRELLPAPGELGEDIRSYVLTGFVKGGHLDLLEEYMGEMESEPYLLQAVVENWNHDIVEFLLSRLGFNPDFVIEQEVTLHTLLIHAAEHGDIDIINTINEYGSHPNAIVEGAVKGRQFELLDQYFQPPYDPGLLVHAYRGALEGGHLDLVKRFYTDDTGDLERTVIGKNPEVLRFVLSKGSIDDLRWAFYSAVGNGFLDGVKILLPYMVSKDKYAGIILKDIVTTAMNGHRDVALYLMDTFSDEKRIFDNIIAGAVQGSHKSLLKELLKMNRIPLIYVLRLSLLEAVSNHDNDIFDILYKYTNDHYTLSVKDINDILTKAMTSHNNYVLETVLNSISGKISKSSIDVNDLMATSPWINKEGFEILRRFEKTHQDPSYLTRLSRTFGSYIWNV